MPFDNLVVDGRDGTIIGHSVPMRTRNDETMEWWTADGGMWKVYGGWWKVEGGWWMVDGGLRIAKCGSWTEDDGTVRRAYKTTGQGIRRRWNGV